MILVEIRPRGGARRTIAVHTGVTVLRGLDAAAQRTWATDLARALRGETSASLDVEIELHGKRQPLSPELVEELGLADAANAVTIFAVDLPGAMAAGATEPPADGPSASTADDLAALEADVATADAKVRQLAAELADAERAATSAADELTNAGRQLDRGAEGAVAAAEARVEAARAGAATARQQLAAAEDAMRSVTDAEAARQAEARARVEELRREQSSLEADRASIVARMVEGGDPGDPKPVEEALAGLRRLRSVKPKPSAKAVELAERWEAARDRLAALPQPPQPPEWLVTPALAALQEAREALTEAESGGRSAAIDPTKVEALDRAHREVLDAEQRAMKKGSRLNRRRLDAAHEAEQTALSALGVGSYGEYLQRIAPSLEGGPTGEDRVAAARAALADAEAVWEELHGGQASPEWTAAKEHQAAVRADATAMLGREVDDDQLADELRSHLETVVDTEWAEQALVTAMRRAGAAADPDADIEAAAEEWLAEAPKLAEARQALEAELSELDGKLAAVEEKLAEQQADAFFGGDGGGEEPAASGPVAALRAAAQEADEAEAEAEAALSEVRQRVAANVALEARVAELEAAADARRNEVDRLRRARTEAESTLAALRTRTESAPAPAPEPAPAPMPSLNGAVDLSAVVGMEAEAYLLARVASLRGAPGGPLPLVIDGHVLTGLSEGAARRVFRLLGRLAGSMQLVVLGDDEEIATWAEGLGDQAAVRNVAR